MDGGPGEGSRADDNADTSRTSASDRLQLEVALLSSEAPVPNDEPTNARESARIVVLAVGDADLRDYITQCLGERGDLRVLESRPGDDALEAARRLRADLVIANVSALAHGDLPLDRPPVIVTGDEPPEALAVSDAARIAFLLQPFNARRLLDTVARLLGR